MSLRLVGHLSLFLPSLTEAVDYLPLPCHMASTAITYFYLKAPLCDPLLYFSTSCLFFFFTCDFFLGRADYWPGVCYLCLSLLFSNSKALVCLNTFTTYNTL